MAYDRKIDNTSSLYLNNSYQTTGFLGTNSTNPEVNDIWTQAQNMYNRYSSEISASANINPLAPNNVLNQYTNEALSMLMSLSSSSKSVKMSTPLTAPTKKEAVQENVTEKPVKETKTTERTDVIKKYEEKFEKEVNETYDPYETDIYKAMRDENLSLKERTKVLTSFRDYVSKLDDKDITLASVSTQNDEALVHEIHIKLNQGECTAKEAISMLKDINSVKIPHNEKSSIADYYNDCSALAHKLYLEAQKEGVLAEALEVLPPTTYIQKKLSLGSETKALTALIKDFDNDKSAFNAKRTAQYGISPERAAALRKDFDEIVNAGNKVTSQRFTKFVVQGKMKNSDVCTKILSEIFDSGNKYTDLEKFYLLQRAYASSKGSKDTITNFVDVFRDMSSKDQEKYLPEIMRLYSKFSDK